MYARTAVLCFLLSWALAPKSLFGQVLRTVGSVNPSRGDGTREVLIYYASETSSDGPTASNARRIAQWLEESGNAEAEKESKAILNDLTQFPSSVHADISSIIRSAAIGNYLIFSNELARANVYLLGRQGHPPSRAQFQCSVLPGSSDPITTASPLSSKECLGRALREAAARFPISDYRFAVVLNGHGSTDRTLMPRLCVWNGEISKQWLANVFEGRLGAASTKRYRDRYGVAKSELMEILGASGLPIGLLLLHSCHGAFTPSAVVPPNIAVMWTYVSEAKYDNIDYSHALSPAIGSGVVEALDAYLRRTQREETWAVWRIKAQDVIVKYCWFAPLTFYLVCNGLTRFRRQADRAV